MCEEFWKIYIHLRKYKIFFRFKTRQRITLSLSYSSFHVSRWSRIYRRGSSGCRGDENGTSRSSESRNSLSVRRKQCFAKFGARSRVYLPLYVARGRGKSFFLAISFALWQFRAFAIQKRIPRANYGISLTTLRDVFPTSTSSSPSSSWPPCSLF